MSEEKARQIVETTQDSRPLKSTHQSTLLPPKAQRLSIATLRPIWQQYNLKLHLTKSFRFSRNRHLVHKLCRVMGLYLNPADKSPVLRG